MELEPKRLSNLMLVTLVILLASAWLGVLIANTFFAGVAVMSAFVLGPLAALTTVPLALAFAALSFMLTIIVPIWGLVGGWLFAQGVNSQFKSDHNPLGVTLLSDTHPIHLRVNELSQALDLPPIKWVGWFDDESINAFAMGLNQEDAVIAFSQGAIKKLSQEELDAVMGHELAHVVNHDMQRMTLAYGVQRSLTWFLLFRSLKTFARWVFTPLSELEIMRFSRQREYWADAIGAVLTSPQAMAGALEKIEEDHTKPPAEQKPMAHFMFQANAHTFFNTHPSINARVTALEKSSYIRQLPMKKAEQGMLAAE